MKAVALTICILAVIVIAWVVIFNLFGNKSYRTESENEATRRGLIAWLLTDSPLLGWLVYKKNKPNDRL